MELDNPSYHLESIKLKSEWRISYKKYQNDVNDYVKAFGNFCKMSDEIK